MRDVSNDERAAFSFDISSASVDQLLTWVYPSLYPVHDPSGDWGKPDAQGRCARISVPFPELCKSLVRNI
jgi:hypothetical protein